MNRTIQIISFVMLGVAVLGSLIWVAWDAKTRGRSAIVITALCVLTWPLGLFLWRSIRPPAPIVD